MPHKRAKDYQRMTRSEPGQERARVRPLVDVRKGNVITLPIERTQHRKGNLVPRMENAELLAVTKIILDRYGAAEPTTRDVAEKMLQWERQYHGKWEDGSHDDEEHIYLGKTREMVQVVHAFFIQLIAQLPELVSMQPMVRSLQGADEEWRRASVANALTNFYFDDVWRFRTDVLPGFLKTFLKFTMGCVKICYQESDTGPDLRFDIVDRAFLYIDPTAHDLRDADWLIEKTYLSVREVEFMYDRGYWAEPDKRKPRGLSSGPSGVDNGTLRRFFGDQWASTPGVTEDTMVEVWHYWQPRREYQEDCHAVMVDGTLVRYGEIPGPYKGIPIRGKSYDPHEWKADGTGMVEMYQAIQEIINTLLNMRLDDVRENMWNPLVTLGQFVDQTTLNDIEDRTKFMRLAPTAEEFIKNNPGKSVGDLFQSLGIKPSTAEIFNDMGFLLGQGKEISHISDSFRGQSASKVQTASEVQEMLSQNQSIFRGPFMQVMRLLEEIAEIALAYFKDQDFFGPERIIQVVGPNKYAKVIGEWHSIGGNAQVRSVSPDEMDVDVTIRATNGADALLSRTFRGAFIAQAFQSIGQVEGLYPEVQDHINVPKLITELFRSGIGDVEGFEYTEEERQQRATAREQRQMQKMGMAAKMAGLTEQAKQGARGQVETSLIQAEAQAEVAKQHAMLAPETEAELHKVVAKIAAQHSAASEEKVLAGQIELKNDIQKMLLEQQHILQRMVVEAGLEIQAAKQGIKSSIGTGSNRVNKQPSQSAGNT